MRQALKRTPDMARALARLSLQRGGPRDLAALRDGLAAARDLAALIEAAALPPAELAQAAKNLRRPDPDLHEALAATLADDLPLQKRDGGFVRAGHDPALDETRALRDESRRVIAGLQARYAEETGARTLRVKHNSFLGYFVEVPQAACETFLRPPHNARFVHRQTMQDAMRFSTAELADLEKPYRLGRGPGAGAGTRPFRCTGRQALAQADALKAAAEAVAVLDVAAALAELADRGGWTRPIVDEGLAFARSKADVTRWSRRRLAVDGHPFVANDADLSACPARPLAASRSSPARTWPASPPTCARTRSSPCSRRPAASSRRAARHLGVVDRLFSRVGAADDLARGRSTFMVEMIEAAAILNQATDRSLVILDVIGRGTATFDGLSIAWAAIEHLHDINRCRALFATPFPRADGADAPPAAAQHGDRARHGIQGDVVFLHEVVPGVADRSYGLQVAKLAGLPRPVLERARVILDELEAAERQAPVEKLVDDLPLFAATRPSSAGPAAPPASGPDPLREELAALDPDAMTPREAMEALYRLRRHCASGT